MEVNVKKTTVMAFSKKCDIRCDTNQRSHSSTSCIVGSLVTEDGKSLMEKKTRTATRWKRHFGSWM